MHSFVPKRCVEWASSIQLTKTCTASTFTKLSKHKSSFTTLCPLFARTCQLIHQNCELIHPSGTFFVGSRHPKCGLCQAVSVMFLLQMVKSILRSKVWLPGLKQCVLPDCLVKRVRVFHTWDQENAEKEVGDNWSHVQLLIAASWSSLAKLLDPHGRNNW